LNLRAVSANVPKTGYERYKLGSTHGDLEEHMKRMGGMLAPLHKIRGGSFTELISRFLKQEYPAIYYQFDRTDADGFTRVGRDPLTSWARPTWRGNEETTPGEGTSRQQHDDMEALIAKASQDVDSLAPLERQALMDSWIKEIRVSDTDRLFEEMCDAESLRESLNSVHDEVNRRTLLTADVIGITTTGLARDIATLQKLRSKIVICEEAAEVLEAHMISALMPGVEHLIQIGDHQQLRPQISNYSLSAETPTGVLYQVDRSQFERLAVGQPGISTMPVAQLNVQRRMRPQIARLIRDTMYATLQDHPSVQSLPRVVGMLENVFWLHHDNTEDTSTDDGRLRSHTNTWEIEMTTSLIRHLVRQGVYKSTDIAVLTPYTGQLQKLRTALSNEFEISLSDRDAETLVREGFGVMLGKDDAIRPKLRRGQLIDSLRLATVDNFQGEEAKIVVVSLVRSNKERKVGFLRTKNRINVLLSRAQLGLYLIGNTDTYAQVPMWADVQRQLADAGAVGDAFGLCCPRHNETPMRCAKPEDFLRQSPEGGCHLPCNWRLDACGHRCHATCHSESLHSAFICLEPCPRIRLTCAHMCPKLCGEPCDDCQTAVENVELPCGHRLDSVPCHRAQEREKITCPVLVDKKVPRCGHVITAHCWQDVGSESFACTAPCTAVLECGHMCAGHCGSCRSQQRAQHGGTGLQHQLCRQQCVRPRNTCGHACGGRCHAGQICPPCEARCEVSWVPNFVTTRTDKTHPNARSNALIQAAPCHAIDPAPPASRCVCGLASTKGHARCRVLHRATGCPVTRDARKHFLVVTGVQGSAAKSARRSTASSVAQGLMIGSTCSS